MSYQRVHQAVGVRLFWNSIWARAYPRVVGAARERSWMFFETVLPFMATISYVYVYRAIGAPEEFIGFVIVGGAMTAFWLNVLWSMASQLYWDKNDGNLEVYVLSPAPMMAILLGMAVGGIVMTATRAVVILVLGSLLFNVSYSIQSVPLLVIVFVLTLAALYGMGMMFASIYLAAGREAWHFSNLLQEPIYLLSGMYFPVKSLGGAVATFASIIPLTLGMDAMRQLIFGEATAQGFLPVPTSIGILAVMAAIFIVVAFWLLNRLEEIGRREGRLIERKK
jgi:ABC-2 type transport system permease protein